MYLIDGKSCPPDFPLGKKGLLGIGVLYFAGFFIKKHMSFVDNGYDDLIII